MENEQLVQFHSSAQTLAGEIQFRKVFRASGYSEAEIDQMILKSYLRGKLFRQWRILVAIIAVAVGVYLGLGVVATIGLVLGSVALAWLAANVQSNKLSSTPNEWVRSKGNTWTGEWRKR